MYWFIRCAAAAAGAIVAGAAAAQSFPSKPIRLIIPFVAGGSSDIVGRAIGSKFQELLGQPAVVENKPGANGAIAAEFVAKAEPDGHTILVGSIGVFSINAALIKDLRYHPVRDFAPITLAVTTPNVLITRPDLPAKSLQELVQMAKKSPGRMSYCSSGTGSSDHLTAELLKQMSGTFAVHVPYRGGAACQTDIMGSQVDYSFQNLGAVTNYIKAGRMKALAAAAKAKTPHEVVARLHDATVKALRSPDIAERMNQIGFDVVASTPEEFGRFMREEVERWTRVVQKGGIQPE